MEGAFGSETVAEIESILHSLVANDTIMIDGLAQLLSVVQQVQLRSEDTNRQLCEEVRRLTGEIRSLKLAGGEGKSGAARPAIVMGDDEYATQNPETGLLTYLFPFLPDPTAIDIGANVGSFSERLLKAGFTVYAFEPHPASFRSLTEKLGANARFHPFDLAIGPADGSMELHIATDLSGNEKWDTSLFHSLIKHPMLSDLQFSGSLPVGVRALESLISAGEIPARGGLLKIDAEGLDLDIVRSMGPAEYSLVMMEFWDPAHPFYAQTTLSDLVEAMRQRGYERYIVIYRVDEAGTLSYYCNSTETAPKAWGNVIFFHDPAHFAKAQSWCDATLAPTFFR